MLPPLDEAQAIIERGVKSQALLDHEAFRWIVDDLTSRNLAALVAAPPGNRGADAVSYYHSVQFALTEIVQSLTGYAEAGRAMQEALNLGEED